MKKVFKILILVFAITTLFIFSSYYLGNWVLFFQVGGFFLTLYLVYDIRRGVNITIKEAKKNI